MAFTPVYTPESFKTLDIGIVNPNPSPIDTFLHSPTMELIGYLILAAIACAVIFYVIKGKRKKGVLSKIYADIAPDDFEKWNKKQKELASHKTIKMTWRIYIALILSGLFATFCLYFIIFVQPNFAAFILAAPHIATIIYILQRKKIARTIGIIAWLPLCAGLIGLWGVFFYWTDKKLKEFLIN